MKLVQKKDTSIITIIQDMVRAGESEEKILRTLRDMGVQPKKAKQLLMLGQADVFALIQSEINKLIQANLAEEKGTIRKELQTALKQLRKEESSGLQSSLKNYLDSKLKEFLGLSNDLKKRVAEVNERMELNRIEMQELKIRGGSKQNKFISLALIIIGMLFLVMDLYLFWQASQMVPSIDILIVNLLIAIAGVVILFVATMI